MYTGSGERTGIIVVAKVFDQQGCIAYNCRDDSEARCLPGTLEALRAEGVQIVIVTGPWMYPEYAPYHYIEDIYEFITKVYALNREGTMFSLADSSTPICVGHVADFSNVKPVNLFIEKSTLDTLSYCSELGQSLKQISLSKTPFDLILKDINKYRARYTDCVAQDNLVGARFKSDDSIRLKYLKTLKTGGGFKQCFNDVLGFRLRFDTYPTDFPEYFRVVDLRNGKRVDDGYRAIHLYYQRDNRAYPIEIQLWCGEDYQFNTWSHQYVYKYINPSVGQQLYSEYAAHLIRTQEEFLTRLKELDQK